MLHWLSIAFNWFSEHKPPGKRSQFSAESTSFGNNNILFHSTFWPKYLANLWQYFSDRNLKKGFFSSLSVVYVAFHVMNSKILASSSLDEKYYWDILLQAFHHFKLRSVSLKQGFHGNRGKLCGLKISIMVSYCWREVYTWTPENRIFKTFNVHRVETPQYHHVIQENWVIPWKD